MEIVFWSLIFVIVHSYLLYPVIIKVIALFFKREKIRSNFQLPVSVIISAYNEEKVIQDRIINIAALNYDFTKIEVLVGSDCSTDKTNQILTELKNIYPWLSVFLFEKRRGKVSVLNDLVKKAKNEIILFTDANTVFDRDIISCLILNFDDPVIGGVSGRLKLIDGERNSESKTEEKKYWEYETIIKRNEGKCGVLIGANGGIFAIRKNLFKEIPVERPVTDDLFISLAVLQQNYKFVYESNAVAFEEVPVKFTDEFKRKIRFGATNFHTLLYFRSLLFNKNILLSYSLWAHKVSRWVTPILLIVIFLLNIILYDKTELYRVLLLLQLFLLLLAGLGILLKKINIYISPLVLIFYFLMTNAALFIGLFKFLFGKQTAFWQSTPR